MEQIQKFSAELQVTPDTPQAFIALTSDDPSVAPYHGVNYYLALQKTRFRQLSMFILPEDMAGDLRIILNISNNGHRNWRNGCATALYSRKPEPMLRIGKSYLGTKYVANTLDQDGEESLVIRTDAVDCLTFVEYTLAQALGSSFADNLQKYVIGTASSTVILPGCIILPNG